MNQKDPLFLLCRDFMMLLNIRTCLGREEKKNVTIPEYEYKGEKKINPVYHRATMWSGMHSSLLVYVIQWQKSLHVQSKKQGEESLPWIQNQILWDLLEFGNKHLQTLLIQYSIWRTWTKPTLPSCFPVRWRGREACWRVPNNELAFQQIWRGTPDDPENAVPANARAVVSRSVGVFWHLKSTWVQLASAALLTGEMPWEAVQCGWKSG